MVMNRHFLIFLFLITLSFEAVLAKKYVGDRETIRDFTKRHTFSFNSFQYGGDTQIWSIASDSSGNVYFATGNRLTQWNGSRWESYYTPSYAYLRTLEFDATDSSLYAAGNYTFGKWHKKDNDDWHYTELYNTDKIIWRIASDKEYTYFNSHENLFSFNRSTAKTDIIVEGRDIDYLHKVNGRIYVQIDGDFYLVVNNELHKLGFHTPDRVVSMLEEGGTLYLFTEYSGIYAYSAQGELLPFGSPALSHKLGEERIFSSVLSPDGNFIVGTVVDGCYVIDLRGNIVDHISSKEGLYHTTVLSLHCVADDVWLGLDGSISLMESSPNQTYYNSLPTHIGYVYCHTFFGNKLYLGTNKGLFVVDNSQQTPRIIAGTQGQVWEIKKINSRIILNTDRGVYELSEDNSLLRLHTNAWTIKQGLANSNEFYLSDASGISLFEVTPRGVIFRHRIEGFGDANKNIEPSVNNVIWTNGSIGTVVRLKLSRERDRVVQRKDYSIPQEIDNRWISMSIIDNHMLFYGVNGCYRYDALLDSIVPSPYYNKIFESAGSTINSLRQYGDKFFFISDTKVGVVERSGENFSLGELIFLPITQKMIPLAFRRISAKDDYIAVGYDNGLAIYDTKKDGKKLRDFELYRVEYQQYGVLKRLNPRQEIEFPSNSTDITFYFTHLSMNSVVTVKLNDRILSLTHKDGSITIPYLEHGSYNMQVSRAADGATCNLVFSVDVPFLKSYSFYLIVVVAVFAMALCFFLVYRFRLKKIKQRVSVKQREFLEREQMKFENESLANKVKERDRRLTNFTMASIRFNNILSDIEGEVSELKTGDVLLRGKISDIKRSIKTYRKGEENWKLFERYFNNLYDGYLDRLRSVHPQLTPNDIKTAAYIKLSLSTAEIATLMNIAPSSVDTARHRLRKNLGLCSRESLTSYLSGL